MEEKKTIFDYLGQVLAIFGFNMLCMMCFTFLLGEGAREFSTFYALGSRGLPLSTMLQFLGVSVLIVFYQYLFFTDCVFRKLSAMLRTIGMMGMIAVTMIFFTIAFGWFPVNMWEPWLLFGLCYGVCAAGGMAIAQCKNRAENRRLAEGLHKMKAELEAEKENSK